jgi:hypothetical protein
MNHFTVDRWVDYVRSLASDEDAAAIRSHLVSGCERCREEAAFYGRLAAVALAMSESAAPDAVLERAIALCPERRRKPARPFRIPVQLIYDSFLVPAPAGLRSTWQVGWQALYRAGDCSLDLRIEPELRSSRAAVIGQISNHVLPEDRMADLPVRLKSGRVVVAETRSNQFGEFQIEYEQRGRLQLCVCLDGGTRSIRVPIKSFGPAPGRKRPASGGN